MATTYPAHRELFWWLVVLALAGFLTLCWTTASVEGAAPVWTTDTVDARSVADWRAAVAQFRAGDPGAARELLPHDAVVVDPALTLWQALVTHATERGEEALARWETVSLPPESAVWQCLARVAILLEHDRLGEAELILAEAWRLAPEQPLVHYYQGLFELSSLAPWRRTLMHAPWAAATNRAEVSETALAAMAHLERAVALAPELDRQAWLLPVEVTAYPELRPTVADLLVALGVGNFVGDAHHLLGQMFLDQGQYEVAEEHLDAARRAGNQVVLAYEDLADAFVVEGRHRDAARVLGKTLLTPSGNLPNALKLWRQLRQAGLEEWLR